MRRRYSPFVDEVMRGEELLDRLCPTEPGDAEIIRRVRAADDATISDGKPIADAKMFPLVRAALFYLHDAIDESHRIAQEAASDTGSYWHGMIHRREGDFDNARYWFRRTGSHPAFAELHLAAAEFSPLMAKQTNWDPYLFVGQCEQERFGANEHHNELIRLQRIEFDAMLDYVWRKSFA